MASDIKLIIQAVLESKEFKDGMKQIGDDFEKGQKKSGSFFDTLKQNWALATAAIFGAITAFKQILAVTQEFIDAATQQRQALTKLEAVSKSVGVSFNATKKAAEDLSADGLMPFKDAAQALSNLLASGLSLPKAIELLNTAKDNAITNRQAHLGLSEAVVKFTEGIRNENSMLTDSVGITKNYNAILKDETKELGLNANNLDKATKAQIIANGFIKEGAAFSGQAALQAEEYSAQQSKLESNTTKLKVAIGEQLTPIIKEGTKEASAFVVKLTDWTIKNNAVTKAMSGLSVLMSYFKLLLIGLKDVAIVFLSPLIEGIKATVNIIKIAADDTLSWSEKWKAIKSAGTNALDGVKNTAKNAKDEITLGFTDIGTAAVKLYKTLSEENKINNEQIIADEKVKNENIINLAIEKQQQEKDIEKEFKEYEKILDEVSEEDQLSHLQRMLKNVEMYASSVKLSAEDRAELEKKINEKITQEHMKAWQKRADYARSYVQVAQDITGSLLTIEKNKLDSMDKSNTEAVAAQKKKLRDLAIVDKRVKQAMAVVDAATAVLKTMAATPYPYNIPLAAAQAIAGGLQVAAIESTPIPEYAKGSDMLSSDQLAMVHKGERIIPAGLNIPGVSNADLMAAAMAGMPMIQGGQSYSNTYNQQSNNSRNVVMSGVQISLPNVTDKEQFMNWLIDFNDKSGRSLGI